MVPDQIYSMEPDQLLSADNRHIIQYLDFKRPDFARDLLIRTENGA